MIEQRPLQPTPVGALRFNTDNARLEYFDGNVYQTIPTDSPEQHTGGTRGFIAGGYANTPVGAYQDISFYNIDTTGNSIDFGDTINSGTGSTGAASRTRGLIIGMNPAVDNAIEFVTIASTGNAQDFGDLIGTARGHGGSSNSTRAVIAGGLDYPSPNTVENVIQYVTIAATGNAIDYGDLTQERYEFDACSSPTRAVFGGGFIQGATRTNVIDFVTISTLSNAADFGDLTRAPTHHDAGSNAIRGIFVQGMEGSPQAPVNTIDFVTIATLGNAVDFGDATTSTLVYGRAVSTSRTRLVAACGGYISGSPYNINNMDYVQIMTTGNTIDFGDGIIAGGIEGPIGFSNGHGGLG